MGSIEVYRGLIASIAVVAPSSGLLSARPCSFSLRIHLLLRLDLTKREGTHLRL